jgi:hypothetical protein
VHVEIGQPDNAVIGKQHVYPGAKPVAGGDQRLAKPGDPGAPLVLGGRYIRARGVWVQGVRSGARIGHGSGDIATGRWVRKRWALL